ncbi:hypothetical protein M1567_02125 [Candidatus Marsarchaeota archaeon]|jgi:asparagine N-glycosylation enzyme membrane subunit Stt3|nr:hypothetical protein [Candidatus Marsarchaeota archaeon]
MDSGQEAEVGIAEKHEESVPKVSTETSAGADAGHDASKSKGTRAMLPISKYGYAAIALFIIIIILDIYLRTGMLKYAGFFEPDGFYHFSVIRAAVTHDFAIPRTLVLSGFPTHFEISEPLGLYFVTLFPYAILRYFGASYYTVMRLVPILFGVLDAIGAYYIVRYFAKSRVLGFLAMFFVAISSGDIARTAALVYRGDGFITSFMILSLIFFIAVFRAKSFRKKVMFALLAAFVLGVGTAVWNGAPFTVIVYMLAVIFVTVLGYITADLQLIKDSLVLAFALLLTYAMQHMWMALTIVRATQALSSLHFFIFYGPIVMGALLSYYFIQNREKFPKFTMNTLARAKFIVAVVVIALVVVIVFFGGFLAQIASGGGLVIASSHLNVTIQELQPPTFAFLWASFAYQLFLAPVGIILYLLFANRIYLKQKYTVLHRLNFSPEFLVMLAYFVATFYLQINAVRFNSIVAVPIAIFAAYGLYAIGRLLGFDNDVLKNAKKGIATYGRLVFAAVAIFILVYMLYLTNLESFTSVQADGINANFLSALTWVKNNTPTNATFLAVWPDGSVIEGWANRTSAMDSVGGQNPTLIAGFARFILNTTPDTRYLINETHRPEYLLARYYWLQELGGIATEGNLSNTIAATYGYDVFSSVNETSNSTFERLFFVSQGNSGLSGVMLLNLSNPSDVETGIGSNGRYTILKHTVLYNYANDTYIEHNVTGAAANYTFFMTYLGHNITSAALVGENFTKSNMFKFLYGCNKAGCDYGNGTGVSMKLIYRNSDSRIFKISYTNSTS